MVTSRLGALLALSRNGLALLLSLAACAPAESPAAPEQNGELTLVVLDASSGEAVAARVELLDEDGEGHVALDALPILVAEGRPGAGSRFVVSQKLRNLQRQTDQFYSTGRSTLSLPRGEYRLRVWKGPEYLVLEDRFSIAAGEKAVREARLKRWIDMRQRGWFSADDHIHLPRPTAEANAGLHQWMAAEDLHVANLLQMGTEHALDFAAQYAHGKQGLSRQERQILISGQESPRTHFLGHTIILGADAPIHDRNEYLNLRKAFDQGHRLGGLNGFAHFGRYGGAQFGLSLVLPHELLDFMEVLQFEEGGYDIWYKILNTGFRLAPTAGTDYPWGWSHPGRERFYTRVSGGFTTDAWKEAVRQGHTFVTNGPMLTFRVDGKVMGATVELARPGVVDIEARVSFDPARDRVSELELIENGVVVRTCPVREALSVRILCPMRHRVRQSGWLALRAEGRKWGHPKGRASLAHSAPIYIEVADSPPLARQEEARRMARSWIAILDDLEQALASRNLKKTARRAATGRVSQETILQNRQRLLADIEQARELFREQSR